MRLSGITCGSAVLLLVASPLMAEKYYGTLVQPVSGAEMPAAFEFLDAKTLRYCFQDVEENCYDLPFSTLEGGVIEMRVLIERVADGVTNRHTNIWTWTPVDGGYHGTFAITYEQEDPELQTAGDFYPR